MDLRTEEAPSSVNFPRLEKERDDSAQRAAASRAVPSRLPIVYCSRDVIITLLGSALWGTCMQGSHLRMV